MVYRSSVNESREIVHGELAAKIFFTFCFFNVDRALLVMIGIKM